MLFSKQSDHFTLDLQMTQVVRTWSISPYRATLVVSLTCTVLLILAGVLAVAAGFGITLGATAITFLALLGGAYILPLGGTGMGVLAIWFASNRVERRMAVYLVVLNVLVTALLYALAARFLEM